MPVFRARRPAPGTITAPPSTRAACAPSAHGPRPLSTRRMRGASGGFSLVELIVTMVVLAITVAVSVPMFTGMVNNGRLVSNANELVAAMQTARSEAIRRNVRTILCHSADGATCSAAPGTGWRGWVVFTDADNNNAVSAGELVRSGIIEAPVQVSASPSVTNARIVFRADGLAYGGNNLLEANIRVCLPVTNPDTNVRDVNVSVGGRVAVRDPINAGGTCPAPVNN